MRITTRLIVGIIVLAILATMLPTTAFGQAEKTTLRLAWWGGDARHAMYNKLADMYEQKNPNIKLEREFAAFAPYFEKLATQTAGGNPPDIIHMHQIFLGQFATQGALLELSALMKDKAIDLSEFPQAILDTGTLDGKLYMITLGNSAPGTHFNTELLQKAGIAEPPFAWTWDDLKKIALELPKKLDKGVYAVTDSGGWEAALEHWMEQNGKPLFASPAQLGFTKDDLKAFWSFWEELRAAGALPPAAVTTEQLPAPHPDTLLAKGKAVLHMMSGNQHKLFQNATKIPLGLTTLPRRVGDNMTVTDVMGGAYISLSSKSDPTRRAEAARFVNWFLNDPEVAKIFNAEHGLPGSKKMAEVVKPQLVDADKRLFAMMSFIAPTSKLVIRPPKSGEVIKAFNRAYDELAFGRKSVQQAVDQFFSDAEFILGG